jgi:hypothetical protein
LRYQEKKMAKYVIEGSYWLGSVCAGLGLFSRGLDALGMNFIGVTTKGGEITYHSLMDGTLFFYSIAIATMVYVNFSSQKSSVR